MILPINIRKFSQLQSPIKLTSIIWNEKTVPWTNLKGIRSQPLMIIYFWIMIQLKWLYKRMLISIFQSFQNIGVEEKNYFVIW